MLAALLLLQLPVLALALTNYVGTLELSIVLPCAAPIAGSIQARLEHDANQLTLTAGQLRLVMPLDPRPDSSMGGIVQRSDVPVSFDSAGLQWLASHYRSRRRRSCAITDLAGIADVPKASVSGSLRNSAAALALSGQAAVDDTSFSFDFFFQGPSIGTTPTVSSSSAASSKAGQDDTTTTTTTPAASVDGSLLHLPNENWIQYLSLLRTAVALTSSKRTPSPTGSIPTGQVWSRSTAIPTSSSFTTFPSPSSSSSSSLSSFSSSLSSKTTTMTTTTSIATSASVTTSTITSTSPTTSSTPSSSVSMGGGSGDGTSSISKGAIAGIAVGSSVAISIIALGALYGWRRRRRREQAQQDQGLSDDITPPLLPPPPPPLPAGDDSVRKGGPSSLIPLPLSFSSSSPFPPPLTLTSPSSPPPPPPPPLKSPHRRWTESQRIVHPTESIVAHYESGSGGDDGRQSRSTSLPSSILTAPQSPLSSTRREPSPFIDRLGTQCPLARESGSHLHADLNLREALLSDGRIVN